MPAKNAQTFLMPFRRRILKKSVALKCRFVLSKVKYFLNQVRQSTTFFCLTDGLVKLIIENENEQGVITSLITPVNYMFDPGILQERRHQLTAVALSPTCACLIDIQVFLNLVATNSAFAFAFIRHISQQFTMLNERININSKRHVYGRIANLLLTLRSQVYHADSFGLNLSRQDIADLSRMTKESAIRVLKKFKEDGIISLDGNYIKINDLAKLEEISRKG